MASELIIHLCPQSEWTAAQQSGEYRDDSLQQNGFIHCSRPDQILMVANHYYQGVSDALLLWVDPSRVKSDIRWEGAPGGELFPHIYGPIELEAVKKVTQLRADEDGVYRKI